MLKFKRKKFEEEFVLADNRLQIICHALASYLDFHFDKDLVITSVFRGDNKFSVHKYWRGIDFRVQPKGGRTIYTEEELQAIRDFCKQFIYSSDPGKHKFRTLKIHGPTLHGHLQVNSNKMTEIVRNDNK